MAKWVCAARSAVSCFWDDRQGIGLVVAPWMIWAKTFLGIDILFIKVSCFSLAKTLRDQHEQRKSVNRISEAKTEKLLSEVREM
jgi:hypothetical protein